MDTAYIFYIQKRLLSFLYYHSNHTSNSPLSELSKYLCSELSRIVGYWIIKEYYPNRVQIIILKGDNVLGNIAASHDVLVVRYRKYFYIFDTSIWQFFPKVETIFLGKYVNLSTCIHKLRNLYKCQWAVSEIILKFNSKDYYSLIKILKKSLKHKQ